MIACEEVLVTVANSGTHGRTMAHSKGLK